MLCVRVAHLNLTGRRVDDGDEVFSAEIPPDSSLILTTGLGIEKVASLTTVQAESLGSPPLPLLPGKPSSPYLHGLMVENWADRVPAVGPLWGTGVD